jgi:hypothetical protein
MIVMAASRMSSAISFGVFCRLALDHGDHAVEECLARVRGDLHDEPVRQHPGAAGDRAPVPAALADHRCALASDRGLVHRCYAIDNHPVGRDEVPGLHQHEVSLAQGGGRRWFVAGGSIAPRQPLGLQIAPRAT